MHSFTTSITISVKYTAPFTSGLLSRMHTARGIVDMVGYRLVQLLLQQSKWINKSLKCTKLDYPPTNEVGKESTEWPLLFAGTHITDDKSTFCRRGSIHSHNKKISGVREKGPPAHRPNKKEICHLWCSDLTCRELQTVSNSLGVMRRRLMDVSKLKRLPSRKSRVTELVQTK